MAKYLDYAGTQYLVQKIKGEIPSETDINALITAKLSEYRDDIVTIRTELPSEGEEGILYLIPDTNAQSNDVYITYAWKVVDDTTNPETYGFVQIGGTTLSNSGVTAGTYGPSADVTGNNNATISVPEITVDAKGRVTSVTNRTLTCKNNTYNVYDKMLTIQKNGTNVATFTSNSNTDVTANITVPTKVSELTNDSGYLTSHQSLSNYVTLNTAQEITNTKTFKDANTVVKRTDIEAGNTLPSADKLARNIFQDKNGKELGSIYYYKNTSGDTGLCLRAGDWFSESEGVYSLNASGTNRRAELVLYTNSSGNCCIKPNGLFSAHIKPLDSSVCLAEYGKPFGVAYVNQVRFTNATLQVDVDITATEEHSIGFFGKNNGPLSYITFQKRPSFKDRVAIRVQTSSSAYKSYDFDATCFYPESNNSVDIGSTTNTFKNIYCNNYYKGTTAFGDIVTHNASEFLTSHQSLSSCVKNSVVNSQTIKSTAITRGTAPSSTQTFGIGFSDNNNKYIGNIYGQYATDKSTYVGLYAYKGATTSNGDNASVRVGYDASGNAYTYAPTPATADNSTQIATTAFVKAQGYLTAHQSLTNYVTTNTDQTISGVKSFSDNISTKKIISNVAQLQINARSSADSVAIIAGASASDGGGIWLYGKDSANGSECRIQIYNTTKSRYERVDLVGSQFLPSPSGEIDCGGTSNKWKSVYATNAYITNLNLNGHAFDPTSTSGNIGDIVFAYADATGVDLSTRTTSGSYLKLLYIDRGDSMISETSSGLTGTWKFLGLTPGYVSVPGVQIGGVWKRIA